MFLSFIIVFLYKTLDFVCCGFFKLLITDFNIGNLLIDWKLTADLKVKSLRQP